MTHRVNPVSPVRLGQAQPQATTIQPCPLNTSAGAALADQEMLHNWFNRRITSYAQSFNAAQKRYEDEHCWYKRNAWTKALPRLEREVISSRTRLQGNLENLRIELAEQAIAMQLPAAELQTLYDRIETVAKNARLREQDETDSGITLRPADLSGVPQPLSAKENELTLLHGTMNLGDPAPVAQSTDTVMHNQKTLDTQMRTFTRWCSTATKAELQAAVVNAYVPKPRVPATYVNNVFTLADPGTPATQGGNVFEEKVEVLTVEFKRQQKLLEMELRKWKNVSAYGVCSANNSDELSALCRQNIEEITALIAKNKETLSALGAMQLDDALDAARTGSAYWVRTKKWCNGQVADMLDTVGSVADSGVKGLFKGVLWGTVGVAAATVGGTALYWGGRAVVPVIGSLIPPLGRLVAWMEWV